MPSGASIMPGAFQLDASSAAAEGCLSEYSVDLCCQQTNSCRQSTTDILTRFPPEILLIIFTSFDELESAYRLVTASPSAAKLFQHHGASIVESLICSTLAPVLRPLARSVAVLRTASPDRLPFGGDAYDQQFVAGRVGNNVLADLLDATPEPRRVLVWAARIVRFEHAILVRLLRAAHDTPPREPSYPPSTMDSVYAACAQDIDRADAAPSRARQPRAAWAPSWAERFRVRRALWRLATVLSMPPNRIQLKQLAWTGRSPLRNNSAPDYPYMSGVTESLEDDDEYKRLLLPTVWRPMQFHERHELSCVYSCLRAVLKTSPLDFVCGPSLQRAGGQPAERDNQHPWMFLGNGSGSDFPVNSSAESSEARRSWEEFNAVRKRALASVDELVADAPGWMQTSPQPRDDELGRVWHQHSDSVYSMNAGLALFVSLIGGGLTASPVSASVQLRTVRRLGLVIWDLRRLVGLELAYPDAKVREVVERVGAADPDLDPDTDLDMADLWSRATAGEIANTWRQLILEETVIDWEEARGGGPIRGSPPRINPSGSPSLRA